MLSGFKPKKLLKVFLGITACLLLTSNLAFGEFTEPESIQRPLHCNNGTWTYDPREIACIKSFHQADKGPYYQDLKAVKGNVEYGTELDLFGLKLKAISKFVCGCSNAGSYLGHTWSWYFHTEVGTKFLNIDSRRGENINGEVDRADREGRLGKTRFRETVNGGLEVIGASVSEAIGEAPTWIGGFSAITHASKPVHEDGDINTFSLNSAKATFDFGDEKVTGKDVKYARLYWSTSYSNNVSGLGILRDFNSVTLRDPQGKIRQITANEEDLRYLGGLRGDALTFSYYASADVTDIVIESLTYDKKTFTVGNVKPTTERPTEGGLTKYYDPYYNNWTGRTTFPHYGGWALVVVYENGGEARDINIYDGYTFAGTYQAMPGNLVPGRVVYRYKDLLNTAESDETITDFTILSFGSNPELNRCPPGLDSRMGKCLDRLMFSDPQQRQHDLIWNIENSEATGAGKETNPFRGTIAKFIDTNEDGRYERYNRIGAKEYNNQMDLNTFRIKNLIKPGQTQIDVITRVYSGLRVYPDPGHTGTTSESRNIGLIAFSTTSEGANICYDEDLKIKRIGGSKFLPVSTDKSNPTHAEPGDIVRSQVVIRNISKTNKGDVDNLSITSEMNSASYSGDTTYIEKYLDFNANVKFPLSQSAKNPDSGALVTVSSNSLNFRVGKDADAAKGGFLEAQDKKKSLLQYNMALSSGDKDGYFVENTYKATYKLAGKPSSKDRTKVIKKCSDKSHYIKIAKEINEFKVVNKKFQKSGDNANLFTQIANKNFDVKLASFDKNNKSPNVLMPSGYDDVLIDIVTDKKYCNGDIPVGGQDYKGNVIVAPDKNGNILKNNSRIVINNFRNNTLAGIKNLIIPDAYQTLYFRISVLIASGGEYDLKTTCDSDPFTVRPKRFQMYDFANKVEFKNTELDRLGERLIGAKTYLAGLRAIDNTEKEVTKNYNALVSGIKLTPIIPNGCGVSTSFLDNHLFNVNFAEGKGQGLFTKDVDGKARNAANNFSYPNVGIINVKVVDDKYANVDKEKGDCIAGSGTDQETDGKIGCNIEVVSDNFRFYPQNIVIENTNVKNSNTGQMTYMDSEPDGKMYATLSFDAIAKLADPNIKATLYNAGCYSADVYYKMNLDNDNNLKGWELSDVKDKIFYYADEKNKNNALISSNKGEIIKYKVENTKFIEGTANNEIKFNFSRDLTDAKIPVILPNTIFNFPQKDLKDSDNTPGAEYKKPTNISTALFYYGMVYTPYHEGPGEGFDANVYYGVYCDKTECLGSDFRIDKNKLPGAGNWYVNKLHTNKEQGNVSKYDKNLSSTDAKEKDSSLNKGVFTVHLKGTPGTMDTIKMSTNGWLLYNPVNKHATTNNFEVRFITEGGWAGRAMDQGSDKARDNIEDRTRVIGDQNKFENVSKRTNRRITW